MIYPPSTIIHERWAIPKQIAHVNFIIMYFIYPQYNRKTIHVNIYYFHLDNTLIIWKLTRDDTNYGVPQKRLKGHSHFISDIVLSSDGNYALSGSWDKTLRLWDLAAGKTTRRFEDHTKVRMDMYSKLFFIYLFFHS